MSALDDVLAILRCPVCLSEVRRDGARLVCGDRHSFDIARQGYVNLATGRGGPGTGDSASMVAARESVLRGGLFAPVTAAVTAACALTLVGSPDAAGGPVLDLAGGTGHHLAAVLDHVPSALGLCLDLSVPALRRAARAHLRAAAVGADAWARLPIVDSTIRTVLSIFGPRDPAELDRVLAPGGRIVVVAAASDHLGELIAPLGMVGVDPRKDERQAATFARFRVGTRHDVRYPVLLDHGQVTALVSMGPTADHVGAADLAARVASLPGTVEVTIAVTLTVYVR